MKKKVGKFRYSSAYRKQIRNLSCYAYMEMLEREYPDVAEFLNKQMYIPHSDYDIREFVQQQYVLRNKNQPITKTYGEDSKQITIYPSNFYNAYYSKIWNELTVKERARVVLWHIECRLRMLNEKYKIVFFPNQIEMEHTTSYGFFDPYNYIIFFNYKLLSRNYKTAEMVIVTIEHELTHLLQVKYGNTVRTGASVPTKLYDYACRRQDVRSISDLISSKDVVDNDSYDYVMYSRFIIEAKADERGMKWIDKYYALNKKQFGEDEDLENAIKVFKVENEYYRFLNEDDKDTILGKISRQADYLNKLAFTRNCLFFKKNEIERKYYVELDAPNQQVEEYVKQYKQYCKKLKLIDNTIAKFLKSGEKQPVPEEVKDIYDEF